MSLIPLGELFDMVASFGDINTLKLLIKTRCEEIEKSWPYGPPIAKIINRRDFWYIRAFFFMEDTDENIWDTLKAFSGSIFLVRTFEGEWRNDHRTGWPKLNATKIFQALDSFVEKWPKVPLPGSHGTNSPPEEKAYRFLHTIAAR